jgi:chromosomal replication initiation ATPase DnaA
MNKHILRSFLDNVTQHYGIPAQRIFSGAKDFDLVESRRMFFYLCFREGIPVVTIQKFLESEGCPHYHTTIIRGVKKITKKIESNDEYQKLIEKLSVITANV